MADGTEQLRRGVVIGHVELRGVGAAGPMAEDVPTIVALSEPAR